MARPRRNKKEQLEDLFADLPVLEQAAILDSLRSLHRWCVRERSRAAEKPAEQPLLEEAND